MENDNLEQGDGYGEELIIVIAFALFLALINYI